jgi:hypothetical protein
MQVERRRMGCARKAVRRAKRVILTAAVATAWSLPVAAAPTVEFFDDREAWESALPTDMDLALVDFDEFVTDASFLNEPVDVDIYSLERVENPDFASNSDAFNLVDSSSDTGPIFDIFNVDDTSYALMRTEADQNVRVEVDFAPAALAWGADTGRLTGSEQLALELFFADDESLLNQDIVPGDFIGFVASGPVTRFQFLALGSNGDVGNGLNFGIDNTGTVLVPEPATLLLFAIGLGGLSRARPRL